MDSKISIKRIFSLISTSFFYSPFLFTSLFFLSPFFLETASFGAMQSGLIESSLVSFFLPFFVLLVGFAGFDYYPGVPPFQFVQFWFLFLFSRSLCQRKVPMSMLPCCCSGLTRLCVRLRLAFPLSLLAGSFFPYNLVSFIYSFYSVI